MIHGVRVAGDAGGETRACGACGRRVVLADESMIVHVFRDCPRLHLTHHVSIKTLIATTKKLQVIGFKKFLICDDKLIVD